MPLNLNNILALFSLLAWLTWSPLRAEDQKLPEGVEALESSMQAKLARLYLEAQKYRGLPAKTTVPMGQLGKEGLKKKMLQMFGEELPAEKMNPLERGLKIFGLIPAKMDLAKYYPELLTSQVGGFYDPKRKYLVMVKQDGAGAANNLPPEAAGMMDEIVMVHEMTHSLQDQYYDLQKLNAEEPLNDASAAKLALIEGDATHVMYSYTYKQPLEGLAMMDTVMDMLLKNPDMLIDSMPELPGAKELAEAPAYLREGLLFSYMQGLVFVLKTRRTGGQALLDYAFTTDPPRSTAQILHPELWFGAKRRDPALVNPPAPEGLDKKITEGVWGEFNTRIILMEHLGKDRREECTECAQGWAGDSFSVYEKNGKDLGLWNTVWLDNASATKFYRLARQAFKEEWRLAIQPDGTQVFLVLGECTPEEARAYQLAMTKDKVARPLNKPINLVALKGAEPVHKAETGASAATPPPPPAPPKAAPTAPEPQPKGEPELAQALEQQNVKALLKDPTVRKSLKKMLEQSGLGGPNTNIDEVLDNPLVAQMLEQMLKNQTEKPKGNVEQGIFRIEKLGLSMVLPNAEGWAAEPNPPQPPLGQILISLTSKNHEAQVALSLQSLPYQVSIEMFGPMSEAAPKMMLNDFKKIKSGFVQSGGVKGYELEYEGTMENRKLHMNQRMYILDGQVLVVAGTSSDTAWEKHAQVIKETLDSLKLGAPIKNAAPSDPVPAQPKTADPVPTENNNPNRVKLTE